MIKSPDYEALVRELKEIEREWMAAVADAFPKQARIDALVQELVAMGTAPFSEYKPDLLSPIWGGRFAEDNTICTKLFECFRRHVTRPLRGIGNE